VKLNLKPIYKTFDKINDRLDNEKEYKIVVNCHKNHCLKKGFLKKAADNPKKIFKKYCKKNDLEVDWDQIKKKSKQAEVVIQDLKKRYKRPRPKKFKKGDLDHVQNMVTDSFPSGHTCSARFVAELLSRLHPSHSSEFLMLSDLIGQSRIENGVHYPSDVLWGKYLGELLINKIN